MGLLIGTIVVLLGAALTLYGAVQIHGTPAFLGGIALLLAGIFILDEHSRT